MTEPIYRNHHERNAKTAPPHYGLHNSEVPGESDEPREMRSVTIDGVRVMTAREAKPTGVWGSVCSLCSEAAYVIASVAYAIPGIAGRMRQRGTRTAVGFGVLAALVLASFGLAELPGKRRNVRASALINVLGTAGPSTELGMIVDGTQVRARFSKDIVSLSVADEKLVKADIANTREVLLTGLEAGATSLSIGFEDDETEIYQLSVQPDFAVLRKALHALDPGIRMDVAPDREAVVLTGTVERVSTSLAAEHTVRAYLDASGSSNKTETTSYFDNGAMASYSVVSSGGGVLNSIRTTERVAGIGERIQDAIAETGAHDVRVRRVQHGIENDDQNDILVLDGTVDNQIALTRALSLASRMFLGSDVEDDDIRVLGDESGALVNSQLQSQNSNSQGIGSLLTGSGAGGGGGNRRGLQNQLSANVARASALELGGGRILSFIEVEDIPQVRVDIRLIEVSRRALLDYNSDFSATWSADAPTIASNSSVGFAPVGAAPSELATSGAGDIQEVFGFLGGAFQNKFQLSGNDWAIDTALSLLETEGIAKSLASPSLTVLSGEQAAFQVGGSVPFEQNVATDAGNAVLQGTNFVNFGVNLIVRPLVGKDGTVTIDVQPNISAPDASLTSDIRNSTGGSLSTTAFTSRSLRTSARLQDGQGLVIGGLNERSREDDSGQTPFIHKIPLLGALFKSFSYADQDRELVFVITPVVLRDPIPDVGLWAHGDVSEMMRPHLPEKQPVVAREDEIEETE